MPAPLAYLITWTTYGTWLPGDQRGWVEDGTFGIQAPDGLARPRDGETVYAINDVR